MKKFRRRWLKPLFLIGLLWCMIGLAACRTALEPAENREVVYTIAAGSAAKVAAGEKVTMLPSTINMILGKKDILIIKNEDVEPVVIDGIKIDPGQRARQQFYTVGEFQMLCAGGGHTEQVKITVLPQPR